MRIVKAIETHKDGSINEYEISEQELKDRILDISNPGITFKKGNADLTISKTVLKEMPLEQIINLIVEDYNCSQKATLSMSIIEK